MSCEDLRWAGRLVRLAELTWSFMSASTVGKEIFPFVRASLVHLDAAHFGTSLEDMLALHPGQVVER